MSTQQLVEAIERLPEEGKQAVWAVVHEWENKEVPMEKGGITFQHAGAYKDRIKILPGFDDPLVHFGVFKSQIVIKPEFYEPMNDLEDEIN